MYKRQLTWQKILCFAALAVSALVFLYSLGLMGLANRTGVKNAWLAWIPVANVYVLGATADMLEEKRGLSHKWSKFLLILTIAVAALFFLFFVSLIALVVYISMMEGIGATSPDAFFEHIHKLDHMLNLNDVPLLFLLHFLFDLYRFDRNFHGAQLSEYHLRLQNF